MHRVQQERADTCSRHTEATVSNRSFSCLSTILRFTIGRNGFRTLTGLLPCAQTVSCCAHAGPRGGGGGEAQLGTVSIVVTAEIGTWENTNIAKIKSKMSCRDVGRCINRLQETTKKGCGTFLHSFIVDFHVHHRGSAVPQDFPVAAILLVTGSYLVGSLVCPPQFVP